MDQVLKIIHILAIISWMAGLLYLPRLFVYHAENIEKNDVVSLLKVMEFRLYRFICWPAMIVSVFTGLALVYLYFDFTSLWVLAKLFCVFGLIVCHLYFGKVVQTFPEKSSKFFRFLNEVPTLLMIGIVCFVILKP